MEDSCFRIMSFLIMAGLLNDHRHRLDKPPHKPIFYSFPAYALVIIIVLLTVYLILAICKELKEYHNTLSPWSVYEAVNNVPCGVCFSDSLGRIILSNTKMQELCKMLTGNYLQNFDSFRYAINSEPVQTLITMYSIFRMVPSGCFRNITLQNPH